MDPDSRPSTLRDEHRDVADRVITALAGPGAALRPDQERAVAALTQPGARVLVVQATGWGKSAVYWAATAIRRSEGAGPTLVVSPLIALMRDQVAAAQKAGLRAATLNSGNHDEWTAIEDALRAGEVDVLLVSPERLAHPGFGRRVLDALADGIGLLVIDEAHAVSDWGHDFRPDYRRVSDVLRRLDPAAPVLATTATANARVTADVAAQLGDATLVLRGPLARSSLQLLSIDGLRPLERFAWVVDHLPTLPGSGIVYALTVDDAHRLVDAIRAVHGPSVPVAAYTGRIPIEERRDLEDALRDNRLKALVATSALGMGYDKPDLGFVVHVGAPPSPVSYYQQVGRAGRAIDHALVALLGSRADDGVWEYFATATLPDPAQVQRLLAALGPAGPDAAPASVPALEASTGIRRGRVELLLKQLAVDGAVDRVADGWVSTGTPWEYDAAHYEGIVATRRREADLMREYVAGRRCLMRLLQEALDDPDARDCGRCSVCLDGLPDDVAAAPRGETARAVGATLRSTTRVLDPRKMWPGGEFGARGRIPAGLAVEPGRVVVHADAPEWAEVARVCLDRDGAPPPDLLDGAVDVLVRWKGEWSARPSVVVDLACGGLPTMLDGVTDHLAGVGRLERGRWPVGRPPEISRESGGAAEAAAWRERLTVPPDLAALVAGRDVLLVADATSSGWPITVGGAALRDAGAGRVLPLLVHRRP
ncbi:RecQ family ATP-dependent DNA helicase [Agilicoccus flavus]|uniref:RecQ family ATP-dependent DNA helicase n=1 Tax=Agilicoccus flavus TaxID=2775968 RepID=UPI001CF608BF|nr:DEAD/DEAH box helicase [Agilicoccus flavus]